MQCILREKLLAQAMKLAAVGNLYRTEGHRFVGAYFDWLEETEKELSGLRSPVSIVVQSEKSSLAAVMDGYLPEHIQVGKSVRKSQRAVAAQSLEKVSKEIYAKIEWIDRVFDDLNDKLCHALAVLASKEPETFEKIQANQLSMEMVWKILGRMPETIPTYNYFCAKLNSTDRNYLLTDIFQKIVSNKTEDHPAEKENKRSH
jgi:hypothetical protein